MTAARLAALPETDRIQVTRLFAGLKSARTLSNYVRLLRQASLDPLGVSRGPSRFSSLPSATGRRRGFGVIYVAKDLATASFEVVIRDRFDMDAARVLVPADYGGCIAANVSSLQPLTLLDSYAQLRDLLLRHEALHGLYFTHAAFREAVWAVWQQLAPDEQRFWTLLLAWINYDVDYPDLVVNEFQSYLLQQDAGRLAGFLARWNGRLRARHPEDATLIASVTGATGRWRDLHRRLAAALADTSGVHSDALILVRAADQ